MQTTNLYSYNVNAVRPYGIRCNLKKGVVEVFITATGETVASYTSTDDAERNRDNFCRNGHAFYLN